MPVSDTEKLAPDLRLTGFDGEWTSTQLNQAVLSLDAGVSVNSEDTPVKDDELGILKTSCVSGGYFDATENKRVLDPQEQGRLKESVTANSIVISRMNTPALVGLSGLVTIACPNLFLPDRLWAAKISDSSSANFIAQLLAAPRLRNLLSARATGTSGSMKNITKGDVLTLPIKLPTLPEQRKIADFLTAVDGRIGQLIQKKALLEDYKKGVMQQLFTQAIRFKDDHGNDFPDWEEKKLGEVYSYITTNSLSRDNLNYESGEVFNIHYGDIHTKFRSHFYLSKENVPYLNDSAEELRIKDECYVKAGDIVLADASEDYADIGKSIEILDTKERQIVAGLHTYILRPDLSQMAIGFGAYLMQARATRLGVMTVAQGTKVLGLPKGYLAGITLKIPSPDEQTKIADFLSAIDRKIESVATQITETQTFKRGLLQQMFV